jgi:hypothetical protein
MMAPIRFAVVGILSVVGVALMSSDGVLTGATLLVMGLLFLMGGDDV